MLLEKAPTLLRSLIERFLILLVEQNNIIGEFVPKQRLVLCTNAMYINGAL